MKAVITHLIIFAKLTAIPAHSLGTSALHVDSYQFMSII